MMSQVQRAMKFFGMIFLPIYAQLITGIFINTEKIKNALSSIVQQLHRQRLFKKFYIT